MSVTRSGERQIVGSPLSPISIASSLPPSCMRSCWGRPCSMACWSVPWCGEACPRKTILEGICGPGSREPRAKGLYPLISPAWILLHPFPVWIPEDMLFLPFASSSLIDFRKENYVSPKGQKCWINLKAIKVSWCGLTLNHCVSVASRYSWFMCCRLSHKRCF